MFNFQQVDHSVVEATAESWHQQLEELEESVSVSPSTFFAKLALAQRYADGGNGKDAHVYALIRKGDGNSACALLDVTYAHPSKEDRWLKVLAIQVEPRLDASAGASLTELANIASTALIKVLGLTFKEHECQKVKVYGTTPLTLDFIEGVAAAMATAEGIRITSHGNWLVIERG